jgi:glycosidase
MEFHVSRSARDRYDFDQALYGFSGNVIFADFRSARLFAQKMNARRDLTRFPEQAVSAGQINAMGLIDEILHAIVQLYRTRVNSHVIGQALEWLQSHLGQERVATALHAFADQFPPLAVYREETSVETYLVATTAGRPHRQITLEEALLLWLANLNPAFSPYRELFDDTHLAQLTVYRAMMASLHDFFDTQPRFGPDNQNLIDMLRAPALASPHSLEGQLAFMREHWAYLLGDLLLRLLSSLDFIEEEIRFHDFAGPGPMLVPNYAALDLEYERYSQDRDWMPRLVLIAKQVYVWLDQLSRELGRPITRLDQIPNETLDLLARRGFTGLWLIGLWERSPASREIKRRCGNPEAEASAYSIYDYAIAHELGGPDAYENLRYRALSRGIRMASDMVPNHMGIDSRWVVEHPDWFISLPHSPFPSYSFNGGDLSRDGRVGIFLEDHYYSREDAAVVFKRVDRQTGHEEFIYHGNDGTRMPWNDTAQLNYLRADVREAVIQTILHVARQFPIIRFDAAMTLAKRHYQRLWFPEPGSGGDIPSRAGLGLTRHQLDELMPVEFWREVVDRAAVEAPDTLLLAEAFWLMEGYFVRTLGMHRVYNSAFMNMLRDEDNAKYRAVMRNTLEFDPEIMRRYVNFMNNPDEETALEQFGKGDKYFGICTLLATLPGLPMFGHGQIEGLAEKYGMEYRRAYWDERPDEWFVARHEREIFPLLHRRALFAGVDGFRLYDFVTPDGTVNEDVFAYSNCAGDERALVVYHNCFAEARGWIRLSVGYAVKSGEDRSLVRSSLAEGLGLRSDSANWCILRDQSTGLEYLRNSQEIADNGLYVELGAYKSHVFVDIHEVRDDQAAHYSRLAGELAGAGVPSVERSLREMVLRPVRSPFAAIVNAKTFQRLLDLDQSDSSAASDALATLDRATRELLTAARLQAGGDRDVAAVADDVLARLKAVLALTQRPVEPPFARFDVPPRADRRRWGAILGWLWVRSLGEAHEATASLTTVTSRAWLDEWLLADVIAEALRELHLDEEAIRQDLGAVRLLTTWQNWWKGATPDVLGVALLFEEWLRDDDAREFLQVNRYAGTLWYNKEAFEDFLEWLILVRAIEEVKDHDDLSGADSAEAWRAIFRRVLPASDTAGYRVDRLLDILNPQRRTSGRAGRRSTTAQGSAVLEHAD